MQDRGLQSLRGDSFSQKQEASGDILRAMTSLKEAGVLKKWGAALEEPFDRRNVFLGDLKRVGVLNPSGIGIASISMLHALYQVAKGIFIEFVEHMRDLCFNYSQCVMQGMTKLFCSLWWE